MFLKLLCVTAPLGAAVKVLGFSTAVDFLKENPKNPSSFQKRDENNPKNQLQNHTHTHTDTYIE